MASGLRDISHKTIVSLAEKVCVLAKSHRALGRQSHI
jgi:hypothetical protein